MWKQYALVFAGSLLVDVVPLPLPPAFTLMIFFQIKFDLNIWLVISVGVVGSIIGRYILTLYIPKIAKNIFKPSKNEDVQYLGSKLKQKGWKSQASIIVYSLLPLPTTPLFIAAGMANMKPIFIIPAFFIGKFISDAIAVILGKYAAENATGIFEGVLGWKSFTGLGVGLLLISALLFIDWRTLLREKKFTLKLNIWK
jgi:membrane protein DedA with SNARE-associated domain